MGIKVSCHCVINKSQSVDHNSLIVKHCSIALPGALSWAWTISAEIYKYSTVQYLSVRILDKLASTFLYIPPEFYAAVAFKLYQHLWCQKTGVHRLLCSVGLRDDGFAILIAFQLLTDSHTYGQTQSHKIYRASAELCSKYILK